jgi:hypothetical protein
MPGTQILPGLKAGDPYGLCRNKKFFDPFPTICRGKAARGHKALWSSHSGNPYCDRAI